MEAQAKQIQAALINEQNKPEELRQLLERKSTQSLKHGGIVGAIKKGQRKHISPKQFSSVQIWTRLANDDLSWHDTRCKAFLESFKPQCLVGQRLTHEEISNSCKSENMEPEVENALHMVAGAFLEGEARTLSET